MNKSYNLTIGNTESNLHIEINEHTARVSAVDNEGKPTKLTKLDLAGAYSYVLADTYLDAHGIPPTDISSRKELTVKIIKFLEDATAQKSKTYSETIEYPI